MILSLCLLLSCKIIAQCNIICNGGADSIAYLNPWNFLDSSQVPCWKTTASDGKIEVLQSGTFGYNSYSGIQFLEINANMPATIYQVISVTPGTLLTIGFAHRGRDASDTVIVEIGPPGGPYIFLGKFGDSQTAWRYCSVNYLVPNGAGINHVRFRSFSWGVGNPTYGNLIDAVSICTDGSNAVGLSEFGFLNKVIISPNPSSGQFTIDGIEENVFIEVFDITGRLILSESITGNNNTIDLTSKEKGVYIYRITDNKKGILQGKFIIK